MIWWFDTIANFLFFKSWGVFNLLGEYIYEHMFLMGSIQFTPENSLQLKYFELTELPESTLNPFYNILNLVNFRVLSKLL